MQLFAVKTKSKLCFKISAAYNRKKKKRKTIILHHADNLRAKCNLAILIGLRVFR